MTHRNKTGRSPIDETIAQTAAPQIRLPDKPPRFRTLLPWIISILLHMGLVLWAVGIFRSTPQRPSNPQRVIPTVHLGTDPGSDPQTTPKQLPLQIRPPLPETWPAVSEKPFANNVSSTPMASMASIDSTESMESMKSAKIAEKTLNRKAPAWTSEVEPFPMAPLVENLPVAPADPAIALPARFFGTGSNARKIVYVVDASGSLVDGLSFVIQELRRSIRSLQASQRFAILFFQGNQIIEVPPAGLKRADATHKQTVLAWLDPQAEHIIPRGSSNPLGALRKAMEYGPQLIFLLSDNMARQGRDPASQAQLLAQIRKANTMGASLHTIQFLYRDVHAASGRKSIMQLIAEQNHGLYKFIDGRTLKIH